jgi:ectoine hydroxylase-related dioxygenase (phytanoyl-CoA dioxygenase family)
MSTRRSLIRSATSVDDLTERFARDGWAVVRGVVAADELAAMAAVFARIIPPIAYPAGPDGVLWEVTGAARALPELAAIARDPRFGALVAEALGVARVQLLQDSLLYKPPRDGGPVEWHHDHTYVGFLVPARVVALRIALVAEDADNCMRVVDGSHRWEPSGGVRALTEARVESVLAGLSAEQRVAVAGARPLVLAAGDISIHHCLTLHGSGPNHGEDPRRTIILRMFDAACRLEPSRLPAGATVHFPTDAAGCLDPAVFPIVHG